MRKESTPNKRAVNRKKEVDRIRRRYKVDVNKKRRLLPGEIPHVQNMIVVLRLAGYSNVQIARIIGISRNQVTDHLKEPAVAELLVSLRARLPQAALDLLQGYMIEAVQAIVDVMRRSGDDKYILQAASEILDRAGLPKASKQERHTIEEERVTFTDDGIVESLREAPIEVQEEAAQLIERLESILTQENNAPVEAEEPTDED